VVRVIHRYGLYSDHNFTIFNGSFEVVLSSSNFKESISIVPYASEVLNYAGVFKDFQKIKTVENTSSRKMCLQTGRKEKEAL
jgi:hypothetical protein